MGSGKTTQGRSLGEALALPVIDLDDRVEARAGRAITVIFQEDGEPGFRRLERASMDAVIEGPPAILSCGGGAPCQPGALDALSAWGVTVFLEISPDGLASRIADRPDERAARPAWSSGWRALYRSRLPVYRRAALCVDAEGPPGVVTRRILQALEAHG